MNNLLKLLRFLAWYGIAVAAFFYVLPIVGLLIEVQYDMLTSSAKFFAIIGFLLVIAVWQVISLRDRLRQSPWKKLDGMAL
ncbi:MAG: hypothetical protein OES53_06370 [Xanthomonadales bacterium]|jgi:positive regulator of sigma E activity|nr:hypothetical protein [Xanthomonadales bacterium]MDH3924767.1 hypothetical protein [Xanthomonadales bacterium]MDH3942018.1 hypothetical protein [Xanthomonadales bacterium]MDH4002569.1 hypothetical protein [Xanthomonadales bacterium]